MRWKKKKILAMLLSTAVFCQTFPAYQAGATASLYKAEQKGLCEQLRDTLKEYRDAESYVIAAYGIENQSGYGAAMPIRVMGYDYGNYRRQLLAEKKWLHPVVTIVLNFSVKW